MKDKQRTVTDRKKVVLVVDDENAVRDVTCRMLQSIGCHTFSAGTGAEAIELFSTDQKFDYLLLDYDLPDMCGITLFHCLHRLQPHIRLLVTSGYPALQIVVDYHLDPVSVLQKPYNIRQLSERITLLDDMTAGLPGFCQCRENRNKPLKSRHAYSTLPFHRP